jgi:VanZ family protein
MSTRPGATLSWFPPILHFDKFIHFFEYLILGFLLINALKNDSIDKKKWNYSILFLLLFPIIDETLQYFTPRRIPSILDGIADILGGVSGAYIRKYF